VSKTADSAAKWAEGQHNKYFEWETVACYKCGAEWRSQVYNINSCARRGARPICRVCKSKDNEDINSALAATNAKRKKIMSQRLSDGLTGKHGKFGGT
jgi:hypothetical protein